MISIDELFKSLTVVELEGFVTNKLWMVVEGTIKERLETVRSLLEVGEVTYAEGNKTINRPATFEEIKGMQGQCKELRWILILPSIWKEQKIAEAIEQKEASNA